MLSKTTSLRSAALALLMLPAVPVAAHHSTAMFDKKRTVELTGAITEFQWTNPHTWIEIDVPQANGQVVHYSIEGGAVRTMEQQGWKVRSLKPGDRVTLVVHPMRSGGRGGMIVRATLPDGRVLSYQPR
jgi:hypothetical protein